MAESGCLRDGKFQNLEVTGNTLLKSNSHILPIVIGKEKTAMEFGKYLLENGIFAQPIRYPTVSHNNARIRISITARLTDIHITKSLSVLESAKRKFFLM